MKELKQYFENLITENTYRGWHLVQAETITHESITSALLGIKKLSDSRGIFTATNENLQKLNKEMNRKSGTGSFLSMRKQVLVNLDAFGFIKRVGRGQDMQAQLTARAKEYLEYEDKEFFMDDFLSNFEMKKERLSYSIIPYPILLKILSDSKIKKISFKEFQYFVSQIKNESEIGKMTEMIFEYRKLSNEQKEELDIFVRQECELITKKSLEEKLPKKYERDYKNWVNNAKHSLEFFNLGSQIKFYGNEAHLLLGSDDLRKQIIDDLRRIEQQPINRSKKFISEIKGLWTI